MWGVYAVARVDADQPLFAKSPSRDGRTISLAEHCNDVMDAFVALFGGVRAPSRLGCEWLRFFKVPSSAWPKFWTTGLFAAGAHDLGKANRGFQDAIVRRGDQVLRHEHLSALLLVHKPLWDWLAGQADVDPEIVLAAVAGHHLKSAESHENGYPSLGDALPGMSEHLVVLTGSPEFHTAVQNLAARFGWPVPEFDFPRLWRLYDGDNPVLEQAERLRHRLRRFNEQLPNHPNRHAMLMAVKAAVLVADTAGSGLKREAKEIPDWIGRCFEESPYRAECIEAKVWRPRIRQIESRIEKPFQETDFQIAARNMPARALLLAPCGSGKTLAAWRWIQARLAERPARNVIFLYPTRATATEGFRDYVSHAPEGSLLHGTASYELPELFGNPDDPRNGCDYLIEDRLYALGYWPKRVFSATVDQFLGFMQQVYRSICLLPLLADSVVVFDEVHSFDAGLFSALQRYLETFDCPVLCMTASLPARRREALEMLDLEIWPREQDRFEQLETLAELPRYHVRTLADAPAAAKVATAAVAAGKRVLWVVNSVDRCQQLAAEHGAICYHSRFTLADRRRRHQEVIDAFQRSDGAVMAVTTQVCEMSLDLDAQVLITEFAPVPALIQRMGRCNRHARDEKQPLGEVYFYPPANTLPYRQDELSGVEMFVAALDGQAVSQSRLDELLSELTSSLDREAVKLTRFISDGPWAVGGADSLRETDQYSVQAVLDSDIEEVLSARRRGKPIDGWLLPAPRPLAQSEPRLGRFPQVVSAKNYLPTTGLHKTPKEGREAEPCLIL